MTTKLLTALGIAGLLVTVGPGIGVAGSPGDASARWVDGLLLLGATVRLAPVLGPIARRRPQRPRRERPAPAPAAAVAANTEQQRLQFREGIVPAPYRQAPDAAEPQVPSRHPRRVADVIIAYV